MTPELVLLHGVVVTLATPVVVGREAVAPSDLPGAMAAAITGDMSVSKTHALVEPVGGSVWVPDLNSSNGTELMVLLGAERRGVHDHIASTLVVRADRTVQQR